MWSGGPKNLYDTNFGLNAADRYNEQGGELPPPGAAQALAFVRERDNLPNGDLDRTHRQQAVIDYVIWKLETEGALTDLGQLTNLLGFAEASTSSPTRPGTCSTSPPRCTP